MVEPELAIMYGSQLPEWISLKDLRLLRQFFQKSQQMATNMKLKVLVELIARQKQEIAKLREENEWLKQNPAMVTKGTMELLSRLAGLHQEEFEEFVRQVEAQDTKPAPALTSSAKPQTAAPVPGTLPDELRTPKAMGIWQALQHDGYIDDDYSPRVSRPIAAEVASRMANELNIFNKWQVFEALWNRKNMRNDYYELHGQSRVNVIEAAVQDTIDRGLGKKSTTC